MLFYLPASLYFPDTLAQQSANDLFQTAIIGMTTNSQPTGVSTFAITHYCLFIVFVNFVSHKPTHRPKIAKELTPLPPKEKLFF